MTISFFGVFFVSYIHLNQLWLSLARVVALWSRSDRLLSMLRFMIRLKITMDVTSLYTRQQLQLILQFLTYIMCLPQRRIPIHYNVHFDNHALLSTNAPRICTARWEGTGPE